jgi:hypothetical protein
MVFIGSVISPRKDQCTHDPALKFGRTRVPLPRDLARENREKSKKEARQPAKISAEAATFRSNQQGSAAHCVPVEGGSRVRPGYFAHHPPQRCGPARPRDSLTACIFHWRLHGIPMCISTLNSAARRCCHFFLRAGESAWVLRTGQPARDFSLLSCCPGPVCSESGIDRGD